MLVVLLSACGGGSSDNGAGPDADVDAGIDTEFNEVERSVLVIGDSISAGDAQFGSTFPWPLIVRDRLGISVTNRSISGEQTNYGRNIIQDQIAASDPSHVVIFLGTNDALRGSVSTAISNLQAMISIATSRNVKVIICTLPPITNSSSDNRDAADISDAIRGFFSVEVADVRAEFGSGDGFMFDPYHPNQRGQELIASTVINALQASF